MTTRERLIKIIDDWADDPDSYEQWGSLLKVNVLIQSEKEFGIQFNSADIPNITGLESLLAYLEPRLAGKKVLVLDCDGVLWGGVIGEGSAFMNSGFVAFQERIVALESNGVLICLCSKNDNRDVEEMMRCGPLEWKHIAASEISWNSKVDGLRRLASRLGLGLDSFVFIDDSEAELAEVLQRLPEVTCCWLNSASFEGDIEPLFRLSGKSLTEQYRHRQTVDAAITEATDRQAFLGSLDMQAEMRLNDESLAARVAELSQKTNQFNYRLRRFTESEIRERIEDGSWMVFCASLKDRFGDTGWVAQAVFEFSLEQWNLHDLCISCRVLGRGFERAFIEKCCQILWEDVPCLPFCFEYVAGPRNQQCERFFNGELVADHVSRAPVKWVTQ